MCMPPQYAVHRSIVSGDKLSRKAVVIGFMRSSDDNSSFLGMSVKTIHVQPGFNPDSGHQMKLKLAHNVGHDMPNP